jgi:hypothetical protein
MSAFRIIKVLMNKEVLLRSLKSYCGKVKEDVKDYDDGYGAQGFCADCAKELV